MKLKETLEGLGYEPRSYSGRGMYGKECVGVVVHSGSDLFADLAGVRGGKKFIKTASNDAMGLSVIVYWPSEVWPC